MIHYPLIPIERSLDGQIWHEMSRDDVRFLWQMAAEYLEATVQQLHDVARTLEQGKPAQLFAQDEAMRLYLRPALSSAVDRFRPLSEVVRRVPTE